VVVKSDDGMRTVAQNNDRGQYELVLTEKIKQLLVGRHDRTASCSTCSSPSPTSRT
jgi:type I restriction enzyme R subunit